MGLKYINVHYVQFIFEEVKETKNTIPAIDIDDDENTILIETVFGNLNIKEKSNMK